MALPALANAENSEWRSFGGGIGRRSFGGGRRFGGGRHSPWESSEPEDYEMRRLHGKKGKGAASAGGGGGGFDASGLEQGLTQGGAGGLIEALKAMQALKEARATTDDAIHIKKDEDGNLMYDFRSPSTTPAPTPAPTHAPIQPPVAARKTLAAPNMAAMHAKVQAQLAQGGIPDLPIPPLPQAISSGDAGPAPQAGAVPPMQQMPPPMQQMPTFGVMPMAMPQAVPLAAGAGAGQAAGGFQLQTLAAGLAAVKERVDVLVEDAQMAMGGQAISGVSMASAGAAQAVSGGLPPELQKNVKDLLPRVAALEKQSKVLEREVKSGNLRHPAGKAVNATHDASDTAELEQENKEMQTELQRQSADIEAMQTSEKSEKERLSKVEAENGELQNEVKALLALEKKRISDQKRKKKGLKHKNH